MFAVEKGELLTDNRQFKARIRTERLALRDAMPSEDRLEFSLRMAELAGDLIVLQPGEVVSGFMPIRSEADIRPLMARLRARGARLCLPVVLNRETIVFRELLQSAVLVNTGFGTLGPGPDAAVLDPDLLLVPLSAFDGAGNRIGYGAGHYDRAIARLREKGRHPRLIGIAFDCQEVAEVPAEAHDVRLEAVLTESGLRTFKL
ncbi:5-formyltetrahydrofolate cyclo-ligase [Peteryoungia ipomoeae]|uniref:5-formyltetrahydrofolate cyclo-ligase n=1 Tax=Peteryoungia ipomoeae TaxID=1210932 RepID=UPI003CCC5CF7